MAANTLNPDVKRTAAKHLVKVMGCVHPLQRRELLLEIIQRAEVGLAIIDGKPVDLDAVLGRAA